MNSEALRKLFEQVRKKRLSPDEAVERLRHLPFEDLGFAKVDHHRALRQGMPEVIFSQGKTPRQVAGIFRAWPPTAATYWPREPPKNSTPPWAAFADAGAPSG
jgi:NCAIR mutase (PurE)-related protein